MSYQSPEKSSPLSAASPNYGSTHHLPTDDHDGYVLVFQRHLGEYNLHIQEAPDGDEIICEPPLKRPRESERNNRSLVYNLKDTSLLVSRYTKYELAYSLEHPDRYIYCIVSINEEEAMEWADSNEIELEAEAQVAVREGRRMKFPLALHTLLPNDPTPYIEVNGARYDKLPLGIWDGIHLPYSSHVPHQDIYKRHGSLHELLENRMQLKILHSILTEDERLGGAALAMDSAVLDYHHPMVAFFALNCTHDNHLSLTHQDLFPFLYGDIRGCFSLWHDKIDPTRNYYGETVAYYFAFLEHYTRSLIPVAIIGVIYFAIQVIAGKISVNGYSSLFIVLVSISWSTWMIETWYRREWELRFDWGMMRAAETAVPRAEFQGSVQISPTTGELFETYSNVVLHYLRLSCSMGTILFCIAVVLSIVAGIILMRNLHPGNFGWSILVGVINSVQIQILNFGYLQLATFLNGWEDHRLQSDYNNHMVIKKIVFYCVNSFNSLFYLAFLYPSFCKPNPTAGIVCNNQVYLNSVRIQLVTLFLTMIIINNLIEFVYPPIYLCIVERMYEDEEKKRADQEQPRSPLLSSAGAGVQATSTKVFTHSGSFQNVDLDLDVRKTSGDETQAIVPAQDDEEDDEKGGSGLPDLGAISRDVVSATKSTQMNISNEIFKDIESQMEDLAMPDMLDNMAELVVQYGYIMLFCIVFPLMPLLGIINNLIEQRVDLYNVVHSQRPVPYSSGGIGVWKQVLTSFSVIAVFSNMGIVCYRSDQITEIVSGKYLNIFFFVASIVIVFIQIAIRNLIGDVPARVVEGIERQEYCERYLIVGAVKNELKEMTRRTLGMSEDMGSVVRVSTASVDMAPLPEEPDHLE